MCFSQVRVATLLAAVATASACVAEPRAPARAGAMVVDDFGDTVRASGTPLRIVSLNPATTELLFAIGAGSRLVGRTHWDLYPDSAKLVPDLGDGMRPNVEVVLAAKPDLVLLYAGEVNRAAAVKLRRAGIPTLSLKTDHIDEFYRALRLIGTMTGNAQNAGVVEDSVRRTLELLRARTASLEPVRVFWPLWEQPLLAAGGGSFLSELVTIAGGRNIYDSLPGPSPQVNMEDVVRLDPDVVVTGPQSASRIRDDVVWKRLRAVREGRVLVVDTMLTLRPAVRLGEAAVSIARLLHPGRGL